MKSPLVLHNASYLYTCPISFCESEPICSSTAASRRCSGAALVRDGVARGLVPVFVPWEAAGTIWSHILIAVMLRLKIRLFEVPIGTRVHFDKPSTEEDRIREAQECVRSGNWRGRLLC